MQYCFAPPLAWAGAGRCHLRALISWSLLFWAIVNSNYESELWPSASPPPRNRMQIRLSHAPLFRGICFRVQALSRSARRRDLGRESGRSPRKGARQDRKRAQVVLHNLLRAINHHLHAKAYVSTLSSDCLELVGRDSGARAPSSTVDECASDRSRRRGQQRQRKCTIGVPGAEPSLVHENFKCFKWLQMSTANKRPSSPVAAPQGQKLARNALLWPVRKSSSGSAPIRRFAGSANSLAVRTHSQLQGSRPLPSN